MFTDRNWLIAFFTSKLFHSNESKWSIEIVYLIKNERGIHKPTKTQSRQRSTFNCSTESLFSVSSFPMWICSSSSSTHLWHALALHHSSQIFQSILFTSLSLSNRQESCLIAVNNTRLTTFFSLNILALLRIDLYSLFNEICLNYLSSDYII